MQDYESDFLVITEDEAGERLDKILALRFKEIRSRTYFHFLFEEQKIFVNGAPVKKRFQPEVGDEVVVHFIITPEIGLLPEPIPLEIIYEDDDLLVVNKSPGMVVHPAVGHWTGTFVNALLHHCQQVRDLTSSLHSSSLHSSLRPGIVHRLDKDTSGLLIAAKSALAQQRLIAMFAERQIHKEYLAICVGNPGTTEIRAPIGRHPIQRKQMAVVEKGGREALSFCKTVAYSEELSLVNVTLATGRTHQIRVHMKHLGTPILGDSVYGTARVNAKYHVKRQMLHAQRLSFKHPMTGQSMELEAKIPEDMELFLKKISH